MKIGFVFDDSLDRTDGVQQYVKALGAYYAGAGHDVRYLVGESQLTEWRGGPVHSLSKNITVHFNKNRLTMPLPARRRVIKAVLQAEAFDVLHVQLPCSPFLAGRTMRLAGPHTAVVGTFHIIGANRVVNAGNRLLGLVSRRFLRRLDAVWAVSPGAQAYARHYYGLVSRLSPNVVDMAAFAASGGAKTNQWPRRSGVKRLVFLGRLVERKGAHELLNALEHLKSSPDTPDFELLIAGDGPDRRRLERQVKNFGLQRQVRFLGYLPEQDKPGLLGSADIAVFPALYGESFGIVLLEAMAAGAGVVMGGNNPGYSAVLQAWPETLADPREPAAFAGALQRLLTDNTLSHRLHDAQQKAISRYDVRTVGATLLTEYQNLLAKRQS